MMAPEEALPADAVPIELPERLNRHTRRAKVARKTRPDGRLRNPPLFRMHPCEAESDTGGYDVLHPTKGWRRYTSARVRADGDSKAKRFGSIAWWKGVPALEARVAALHG